jgi:hypothetical protein
MHPGRQPSERTCENGDAVRYGKPHAVGTVLLTKNMSKFAVPLRQCQGLLALPVQRALFDGV